VRAASESTRPLPVIRHWRGRGLVQRILNECGPEARRVVRYVHRIFESM